VKTIAISLFLFVVAGLCEIGGGYLVWEWLRGDKGRLFGILGAIVLMLYGFVPTLQPESSFGRVYAAYGGVFIVMSLLWGWLVDGWRPDRFDLTGAGLALLGVFTIMWGPRS